MIECPTCAKYVVLGKETKRVEPPYAPDIMDVCLECHAEFFANQPVRQSWRKQWGTINPGGKK